MGNSPFLEKYKVFIVNSPKRIIISAGELSGDEHAAKVIRALRLIAPDVAIRGMGGRNLRAEGVSLDIDAEKSASVMGFGELFGSLGKIVGALRTLQRLVRETKPDLLITVDFAEFNMHLAKAAHRAGVPVLNYISPQVWAWRRYRVKSIAEYIDRAAVIFPFEQEFFEAGAGHVDKFDLRFLRCSAGHATFENILFAGTRGLDHLVQGAVAFIKEAVAEAHRAVVHDSGLAEGQQILIASMRRNETAHAFTSLGRFAIAFEGRYVAAAMRADVRFQTLAISTKFQGERHSLSRCRRLSTFIVFSLRYATAEGVALRRNHDRGTANRRRRAVNSPMFKCGGKKTRDKPGG